MGNVTPIFGARQESAHANATNQTKSNPFSRRVALRFFALGHSIRRIARAEQTTEARIEQLARERYWAARSGDDTGPFPGPTRRVA